MALVVLAACSGSGEDGGGDKRPEDVSPTPAEPSRSCNAYTLIGRVHELEVQARERPGDGEPVVASFGRINEQGAHQVFPLVDDAYRSGQVWYEALLPIRPNGSTGWIPESAVRLGRTDYRIVIDLDRFRLTLWDRCERLATYPIGIGTQDTPTPGGDFFLNSLLKPPEPDTVYGVLAFGLSAYSEVITDWEGGGIVGLHGTNDPSGIGRRVSHGCIRMRNDAIRFLARTVPLGTIVEIR